MNDYRVVVEYSDPYKTDVYVKFFVTATCKEEALIKTHHRSQRDFDKLDAEVTKLS